MSRLYVWLPPMTGTTTSRRASSRRGTTPSDGAWEPSTSHARPRLSLPTARPAMPTPPPPSRTPPPAVCRRPRPPATASAPRRAVAPPARAPQRGGLVRRDVPHRAALRLWLHRREGRAQHVSQSQKPSGRLRDSSPLRRARARDTDDFVDSDVHAAPASSARPACPERGSRALAGRRRGRALLVWVSV